MGGPDDDAIRRDPLYVKYVAAFDRMLHSFDGVSEWQDFTAFLLRFQKTLQTGTAYPILPSKVVATKRLAQCLNPALPAGVHLKALEVYDLIFERIGPQRLAHDLPLYATGIFPLFQYAATNVRPVVISLLSRYFLPLGPPLRMCCKAFLSSVLPGLEEDPGGGGNEASEAVLALVDGLHMAVSSFVFFPALHLALIEAPSLRVAGVDYLRKRFPTLLARQELEHIVADPQMLVAALVACLGDQQLLVQRETMELIVTAFPLKATVTAGLLTTDELVLVAGAALGALLRRELSLTRRVTTWLFGQESERIEQDVWFPIVSSALVKLLNTAPTDVQAAARPLRIIVSLLDRADVGLVVCEQLLANVLESAKAARDALGEEFDASIQLFLRHLDANYLWETLARGLARTEAPAAPLLPLQPHHIKFALSVLRPDDSETMQQMLPQLVSAVAQSLCEWPSLRDTPARLASFHEHVLLLQYVSLYYRSSSTEASRKIPQSSLSRLLSRWLEEALVSEKSTAQSNRDGAVTTLLVGVYQQHCHEGEKDASLGKKALAALLCSTHFGVAEACLKLMQVSETVPAPAAAASTVVLLWGFLAPQHTNVHQYVVDCITVLAKMIGPDVLDKLLPVPATCRTDGAQGNVRDEEAAENIRRLNVLWMHSESLVLPQSTFAAIQMLTHSSSLCRVAAEDWFRNSMVQSQRMALPLIRLLIDAKRDEARAAFAADLISICLRGEKRARSFVTMLSLQSIDSMTEAEGLLPSALHIVKQFEAKEDAEKCPPLVSRGSLTMLSLLQLLLWRCVSLKGQVGFASAQCLDLLQLRCAAIPPRKGMASNAAFAYLAAQYVSSPACPLELHGSALRLYRSSLISALSNSGAASAVERGALQAAFTSYLDRMRLVLADPAASHVTPFWIETLYASLPHLTPELQQLIPGMLLHIVRHLHGLADAILEPGCSGASDAEPSVFAAWQPKEITTLVAVVLEIYNTMCTSASDNDPASRWMLPDFVKDAIAAAAAAVKELDLDIATQRQHHTVLHSTARDAVMRHLPAYIASIAAILRAMRSAPQIISSNVTVFCQDTLSRLLRLFPDELVSAIMETWAAANMARIVAEEPAVSAYDNAALVLLDDLAPRIPIGSLLIVAVHLLRDLEEGGRSSRSFVQRKHITTIAVLRFVEVCCQLYGNDAAVPVLPPLMSLARDLCTLAHLPRRRLPLMLRALVVLHGTISWTAEENSVRLLRELQEVYSRVCELTCMIAGRMFEHSSWLRRVASLPGAALPSAARSEQVVREDAEIPEAMLLAVNPAGALVFGDQAVRSGALVAEERRQASVLLLLSEFLVPSLRLVLEEGERVQAILTHLQTHVLVPYWRNAPLRRTAHGGAFMKLMERLVRVPSATRLWRKDAWEMFLDASFFPLGRFSTPRTYANIVQVACAADRDRMADLLARMAPSQTAALFTSSRESEAESRCALLKRVSFVLLGGQVDEYVKLLPIISEKIVELLRIGLIWTLEETLRCLSVMLIKFSHKHLVSQWPIVLTELYRIFSPASSKDASPPASVLWAACKFIDLAATLRCEGFQMFQWYFFDEVLMIQAPPSSRNDSEVTVQPFISALSTALRGESADAQPCTTPPSRPLLLHIHTITALEPCFQLLEHFSRHIREQRLSQVAPDMAYIEEQLLVSFTASEQRVDSVSIIMHANTSPPMAPIVAATPPALPPRVSPPQPQPQQQAHVERVLEEDDAL